MFKSITEEHQAAQEQKRERLKQLENKIIEQAIPEVSGTVFSSTNAGSEDVFLNQRQIDDKIRSIRDEWRNYANELEKWKTLIVDFNRAVAETGSIGIWSREIQGEIQSVVERLDQKKPTT
jgi:L-lactate utilization protein LutC